jgi:hypothetical protein
VEERGEAIGGTVEELWKSWGEAIGKTEEER